MGYALFLTTLLGDCILCMTSSTQPADYHRLLARCLVHSILALHAYSMYSNITSDATLFAAHRDDTRVITWLSMSSLVVVYMAAGIDKFHGLETTGKSKLSNLLQILTLIMILICACLNIACGAYTMDFYNRHVSKLAGASEVLFIMVEIFLIVMVLATFIQSKYPHDCDVTDDVIQAEIDVTVTEVLPGTAPGTVKMFYPPHNRETKPVHISEISRPLPREPHTQIENSNGQPISISEMNNNILPPLGSYGFHAAPLTTHHDHNARAKTLRHSLPSGLNNNWGFSSLRSQRKHNSENTQAMVSSADDLIRLRLYKAKAGVEYPEILF